MNMQTIAALTALTLLAAGGGGQEGSSDAAPANVPAAQSAPPVASTPVATAPAGAAPTASTTVATLTSPQPALPAVNSAWTLALRRESWAGDPLSPNEFCRADQVG